MAKASIAFRCGAHTWNQPDSFESGDRDDNGNQDHAERQAYRDGAKTLQSWYDERKQRIPATVTTVDLIIRVDQAVCPSCQLWMITGVLRDLQKLDIAPRTARLFVAVKRLPEMQVTRNNVWPVTVGDPIGDRTAMAAFFAASPRSQLDWLKRNGKINSMSDRTAAKMAKAKAERDAGRAT